MSQLTSLTFLFFLYEIPGTPTCATVYPRRCGHATPSKHAVSSGGKLEESSKTGTVSGNVCLVLYSSVGVLFVAILN